MHEYYTTYINFLAIGQKHEDSAKLLQKRYLYVINYINIILDTVSYINYYNLKGF